MTFSDVFHPLTPARVPFVSWLKDWHARRHARRHERLAIDRLGSLSSHLLDDIGVEPVGPIQTPRPELWIRAGA